jgi:hypothetical protein
LLHCVRAGRGFETTGNTMHDVYGKKPWTRSGEYFVFNVFLPHRQHVHSHIEDLAKHSIAHQRDVDENGMLICNYSSEHERWHDIDLGEHLVYRIWYPQCYGYPQPAELAYEFYMATGHLIHTISPREIPWTFRWRESQWCAFRSGSGGQHYYAWDAILGWMWEKTLSTPCPGCGQTAIDRDEWESKWQRAWPCHASFADFYKYMQFACCSSKCNSVFFERMTTRWLQKRDQYRRLKKMMSGLCKATKSRNLAVLQSLEEEFTREANLQI